MNWWKEVFIEGLKTFGAGLLALGSFFIVAMVTMLLFKFIEANVAQEIINGICLIGLIFITGFVWRW